MNANFDEQLTSLFVTSNGTTITLGNGAGDAVSANGVLPPFAPPGGVELFSSHNAITLGNGDGDTVTADISTDDAITLGNGDGDTVTADNSNHNTITLGNGNNDVVNASLCSDSAITLGNGNDTVYGGANDIFNIGNGNNQLVAAPGDVWTVGKGPDTFAFNAGFGNNTITDFNTSRDVLQFSSALLMNYAAAMVDTKQVGANTVITLDANDTVTLTGVEASHLTASNFKFT